MKNLKLTFCNNLFVYTKVGENNVFLLYWSDKIVSLSLWKSGNLFWGKCYVPCKAEKI